MFIYVLWNVYLWNVFLAGFYELSQHLIFVTFVLLTMIFSKDFEKNVIFFMKSAHFQKYKKILTTFMIHDKEIKYERTIQTF